MLKPTLIQQAVAALLIAAALPVIGASQPLRRAYIVQLTDAPVASFSAKQQSLAAPNSRAATRLDLRSNAVAQYRSQLASRRQEVLATIGQARALRVYEFALNGMALMLTDAEAKQLTKQPGVRAVSPDRARTLSTNRTPGFLQLSTSKGLWTQRDAAGHPVTGEDVIIGMVDSGIWPEDLSFTDRVDANGLPASAGTQVYAAPPAKWHGSCDTGPGFTASNCNQKLIGARIFKAGFDAVGDPLVPDEYVSARGLSGHGSHTASIAAGNSKVETLQGDAVIGEISGLAPRARIAVYKVCWTGQANGNVCYDSDSVAAIDQAVQDGVDVINFSISGSQTSVEDPVEQAFLNAATAGVFVATAAGNSGGNTVNHPSPWVTTAGASTTDKNFEARLTLGQDGKVICGPSMATATVQGQLIRGADAAATAPFDDTNILARLCAANSLDPAKVAGKVVVCDRGSNGRVDKSAEVLRAGGVGMVLLNVGDYADSLYADVHAVPTVHLPVASRKAVLKATASGSSASIGMATNHKVTAPVVASFSGRGPNLADIEILKPDLSAPGVNILGADSYSATQAEHDAIVNGSLTPPTYYATHDGTSMASPHVAGTAALLRQLHPGWSPAAIRSALMTTTSAVLQADGSADADRMGYGSGEIRPKAAAAVELVYDTSRSDYDAYLCGKGLADADTCANAGSVSSQNLNLPSLTAVVPGQTKIERRLTNVSEHAVTYSAKAQLVGFDVKVKPAQLTLAPGESAPFTVVLSRTDAPEASWQYGSLTWKSSQGGQPITSPLSALQQSFKIATNLSSQSASFKTALSFTAGYSGALDTRSTGLIAGQALAGTVTAQDFSSCVNIPVAAGSLALHLQMFDSDTSHPGQDNLALSVTGPDGNGYWSGQPGANQAIDVAQPAQGSYQACVLALSLVGDASSYTVWSWDLPGSGSAGLPLSTTAPTQVKAGQNGKIKLAWSVPDAQRYMGAVQFRDGKGNTLATTSISVDPQSVGTVNTVRGNARHQDPGLQTR